MSSLAVCLSLLGIGLFVNGLERTNFDFDTYILPWFQAIISQGRFAALHANFADYTPPYIYVLSIGSVADGYIQRTVIVKLCSMAFGLLGATEVYNICRIAEKSKRFSVLSAVIFYMLPEVSMNMMVWGQSDIIYVAFLLAFLRRILENQRFLAMIMFGLALSFKPQVLFVAPFVGYFFAQDYKSVDLMAKAIRDILAVPATYAIMMIPAVFAGRSLGGLFLFYSEQFSSTPVLNAEAPNLYLFAELLRKQGEQLISRHPDPPNIFSHLAQWVYTHQGLIGTIGLLAAFGSCAALLVIFSRQRLRPSVGQLLTMIALTALIVPFVTPKMHERYFIAAGVLTYLATLVRPRLWPAAFCLQASAVIPYTRFIYNVPRGLLPLLIALGLVCCSVVLLLRVYVIDHASLSFDNDDSRSVK